jgi:hypothetical protein
MYAKLFTRNMSLSKSSLNLTYFFYYQKIINSPRSYMSGNYIISETERENNFNFNKFYELYQAKLNHKLPDISFLYWFLGFSEADGSWNLKERGKRVYYSSERSFTFTIYS